MTARIISDGIDARHSVADCAKPGPLEFKLREPLEVEIDGVRYRAPAGVSTDGASTPRIFRNLVPRIGRHIYGAIIHDAAYRGRLQRLVRHGVCIDSEAATRDAWLESPIDREWADHAFLALMEATHTGWLTRRMAYAAVRLFGWAAYRGGGGR